MYNNSLKEFFIKKGMSFPSFLNLIGDRESSFCVDINIEYCSPSVFIALQSSLCYAPTGSLNIRLASWRSMKRGCRETIEINCPRITFLSR
jgi:hypothetical protein